MGKYLLPLLLLMPAQALAHKLNIFAQAEGTTIVGRVYFTGDIPARQVDIIARDPSGRELGRAKTDDQGNFAIPASVIDYHLTVETADGHAASATVSAAELPMTHQNDQAEQGLRVRDMLGGIGYILGLAGIATYIKSRQRKWTLPTQDQH